MNHEPIPFERMNFFLKQLELDHQAQERLDPWRQHFMDQSHEFGREFCRYFLAIERTKHILEQGDNLPRLEKVLGEWFHALFSEEFSQHFLTYLWNSGVRHVNLSLDQRFVNLGYAMARQFCHRIVDETIPPEHQERVAEVIDRMLDFCVLVATDSFITMTSRCDRQMIEGIAHQVRNPITIIGGNIRRLQKKTDPASPAYQAYEMVLKENQRLERMMGDIAMYTGMFQEDPVPQLCALADYLDLAHRWVLQRGLMQEVAWRPELPSGFDQVLCDPQDLEAMLRYVLENAAEAADPEHPLVEAASGPDKDPHLVCLAISNNGKIPEAMDMDEILSPFHSTKPMGTGLGLPIVSLAARRNLGALSLEPNPEGGAVCRLSLPAPAIS
ncbi:MAG: protoglobin domain-containing protein [Pseudomonadota bacterium]